MSDAIGYTLHAMSDSLEPADDEHDVDCPSRECGGGKYAQCARGRVAKLFTCALNMPVSTHTCATFSAHTSVCDALDDAANGASAALAARQAAPCEPCVRNDTAGAYAPTGGGQPRHKQ